MLPGRVAPPKEKDATKKPPAAETLPAQPLTAAQKAARIEKIKRDYEEIRAKASSDYSAAGASFPGGLNAYLRQVALLEKEKRADFARILTPAELEDLEMQETSAGQLTQRLLRETQATDEQRRAAFRLQLEFEDRFALTFDITPPALFEREAARQQMQEKIRLVLGDKLFAAWLAGEGLGYDNLVSFVSQQNLPASASLDLWRIKNEFTVRQLEINSNRLNPDQRAAALKTLVQQTETKVVSVIGANALQSARSDILQWLPKK